MHAQAPWGLGLARSEIRERSERVERGQDEATKNPHKEKHDGKTTIEKKPYGTARTVGL